MTFNIALVFHSTNQPEALKLSDHLTSNGYIINQINEQTPERLSTRAQTIKLSECLVVITSRSFQKQDACMELIHLAKDFKKSMFAINPTWTYKPFGALGAILAGSGNSIFKAFNQDLFNQSLQSLSKELSTRQTKQNEFIPSERLATPIINLNFIEKQVDVLISYHSSSKNIADIIQDALTAKSVSCCSEDSSLGTTCVKSVKVVVVVMSEEYEKNYSCRFMIETARKLSKKIVPVSITRAWKPTDWLSLVIAGKLFFRIMSKEQAYSKKYDSTPINDFVIEVLTDLTHQFSMSEREKELINYLNKRIEECKAKLNHWPPKQRFREIPDEKPVRVVLEEPKAKLEFVNIHTTVTRIEFKPPQTLYDKNGIPLRRKFDCMISYQWDQQELVRNLFMDFHMRNLAIWFDIWGGMSGSSNDAMATAIECSKVILVFISNKYQQSDNCRLEFNYAIARGKPFIFVVVDPKLVVEDWIKPYFDEYPKYEMFELKDEDKLHNGVPRIDVISQAVKINFLIVFLSYPSKKNMLSLSL